MNDTTSSHRPGCPLFGPQTWQSAWADCSCGATATDPFPHAVQTLNYGTQIDGLSDVTRVEVIDNTGRPFARWYAPGVIVQVQDDGRTLKVFAGKPQERKRR